jgi:basic membrane protein A
MGVVAGLTTKTNKIGFVGGIQSALISKFEDGFKAGVATVNPKATVMSQYVGSFSAADKGQAIAASFYGQGADIIYSAAGQTGNGVFTEAQTSKKNGQKVWVIGVAATNIRIINYLLFFLTVKWGLFKYCLFEVFEETNFHGSSIRKP